MCVCESFWGGGGEKAKTMLEVFHVTLHSQLLATHCVIQPPYGIPRRGVPWKCFQNSPQVKTSGTLKTIHTWLKATRPFLMNAYGTSSILPWKVLEGVTTNAVSSCVNLGKDSLDCFPLFKAGNNKPHRVVMSISITNYCKSFGHLTSSP